MVTRAHVVFLRAGSVLLHKDRGDGWRSLQDTFDDYMTSLGPWTEAEIVECFEEMYGEDQSNWPMSAEQVAAFMTTAESRTLRA